MNPAGLVLRTPLPAPSGSIWRSQPATWRRVREVGARSRWGSVGPSQSQQVVHVNGGRSNRCSNGHRIAGRAITIEPAAIAPGRFAPREGTLSVASGRRVLLRPRASPIGPRSLIEIGTGNQRPQVAVPHTSRQHPEAAIRIDEANATVAERSENSDATITSQPILRGLASDRQAIFPRGSAGLLEGGISTSPWAITGVRCFATG